MECPLTTPPRTGSAQGLDFQERANELERLLDLERSAARRRVDALIRLVHDLRGPLTGILGFARLLLEDKGGLAPWQRQALNKILSCGQYELSQVDDLLELARISHGFVRPRPLSTPLVPFVHETIELLRGEADRKAIALAVQSSIPERQAFEFDGRHLRRVLLNLCSNAIRFTECGSVNVGLSFVEYGHVAPAHPLVRFSVTDTGIGMDANRIGTGFQLFAQHPDAPNAPDGYGIGLVVVQELVQALGGELKVHSKIGRGSRFWFDLSLSSAADHWPAAF